MARYTFTTRGRPRPVSGGGSSTSTSTGTTHSQTLTHLAAPTGVGNALCQYSLAGAATETAEERVAVKPFEIKLTKNAVGLPLVPGSISFTWAGNRYVDRQGSIFRNPDPVTGVGVLCGTVDYKSGVVTLDVYDGGDNQITVHSLAGRLGSQYVTRMDFRTPAAPLREGSLTIAGVTMHGKRISAVASFDGTIKGTMIDGGVDYATGIVTMDFGELVPNSAALASEDWYNPELVTEDGTKVWKPEPVYADSFTYACVAYSYIPLSAKLLGLNPVRLPSDGRVPIVKPGDIVVLHNTQNMSLDNAPAGGQVIQLPRAADNVEIYDSTEPAKRVPSSMYAHKRGEDKLTIDAVNNDFSGYKMPLVVNHRIEDMVLVSETSISGSITLAQKTTHAYPKDSTFISSALIFGDLQARAHGLFDQKTWKNAWSNDIDGDQASASYNEIDYPIQVRNSGAVNERWALVFDSTEHFRIHAELRGIVGEGYISNDCQPLNTATGKSYFFIDHRGWGTGWAAGNVLRFNTEGSTGAIWAVRTTLQGPESEPYDWFTIQPRGDAR